MDLASRRAVRLTHEFQAGAPAWSPDGKTIAYFHRLRREDYSLDTMPGIGGMGGGETMEIRTVNAAGGTPVKIGGTPRSYGTIFFLPDGRLGWTVMERTQGRSRTRIEASAQGAASAVTAIHLAHPALANQPPRPKDAAAGALPRYGLEKLAR